MAQLFRNNAESQLAALATAGATSLTVDDGSVFPSPTGGDFFLITLTQPHGSEDSWEIVRCTARSGNTLTVTRAQEGTAAVEWPANTKVSMRFTAGTADVFKAKVDSTSGTATGFTVDGITSEGRITETTFSSNAGTAFTVNFSTHGTVIALTLNQANCNLTFPAPTDGDQFTLMLTLGAAGRTYAFPGTVRWDADGAPDPSTASGATDTYTFQGRSGFWLARGAGNGFVLS